MKSKSKAMKKQDLIFTYQWTTFAGDEPNVSGYADGTFFNRKEGYEMLFLIRTIKRRMDLINVTDLQRLEFMLKKHLPKHLISQRNVIRWIEANWSKSFSCCEVLNCK